DRAQVHLGLARGRDAIEEKGVRAPCRETLGDRRDRSLLGGRELRRDIARHLAAEERIARALLLFDHRGAERDEPPHDGARVRKSLFELRDWRGPRLGQRRPELAGAATALG